MFYLFSGLVFAGLVTLAFYFGKSKKQNEVNEKELKYVDKVNKARDSLHNGDTRDELRKKFRR